MRCQRHAKCNAVAGIPPTARAHAVEQHTRTEIHPLGELSSLVITTLPDLLEGNVLVPT
jgi:hypothetical protein